MLITDRPTVEELDLKSLAALESSFRKDELFHDVKRQQDRRCIWKKFQQAPGLILSIYSFSKGFKYLNLSRRF
jgi:hypothetical protein